MEFVNLGWQTLWEKDDSEIKSSPTPEVRVCTGLTNLPMKKLSLNKHRQQIKVFTAKGRACISKTQDQMQ
jgi:hypothetical protein